MPIPQPDTANTGTERDKAKAALALLLLRSKKRYSLPGMIAAQGIRPRRFRQIKVTQAQAGNMAAPHFLVVRAWEDRLPDILASLPNGHAAVAAAIESAAASIPILRAQSMVDQAVATLERQHRAAWVSRINASTGIDVTHMTTAHEVQDPMAATRVWSQALVEDVSGQVRAGLSALVLAGVGLVRGDVAAPAREVIAKGKRRAAGIGVDQAVKLNRAMTRDRSAAAGVESFMWLHNGAMHPRAWHVARHGNVFTVGEIPANDRAGVPAFCGCDEIPVLG